MIKEHSHFDSIETMHMERVNIFYVRKNKLNVTIKWSNTKIFNFDYIKTEDIKENNPDWSEIPDHIYRTLIIGSSGSG